MWPRLSADPTGDDARCSAVLAKDCVSCRGWETRCAGWFERLRLPNRTEAGVSRRAGPGRAKAGLWSLVVRGGGRWERAQAAATMGSRSTALRRLMTEYKQLTSQGRHPDRLPLLRPVGLTLWPTSQARQTACSRRVRTPFHPVPHLPSLVLSQSDSCWSLQVLSPNRTFSPGRPSLWAPRTPRSRAACSQPS